jgi:hypothetical protein
MYSIKFKRNLSKIIQTVETKNVNKIISLGIAVS